MDLAEGIWNEEYVGYLYGAHMSAPSWTQLESLKGYLSYFN